MTVATPQMLKRMISLYQLFDTIDKAYDTYHEATHTLGELFEFGEQANANAAMRERVSDDILTLSCLDAEARSLRDRFIIDFDLLDVVAEIAGAYIEEYRRAA